MRKMCRRCRTYCYCSRECQELDWNRAIYGHREECMEVAAEMRKLLAAIQNGQLQLPWSSLGQCFVWYLLKGPLVECQRLSNEQM